MPSEVKTSYMDRTEVTEERGEKVNYADSFAGVAKNIYENCGDIFNIWIDELRKININPWVSIRMNDCHCLFDKANILVPPEYYENFDKNSRIRHRNQFGYYDRCLDFELENVRSYTKAYIDETLSKYDVYGIEFDFQRELECFGIGREEAGREVMTEFVGELRALVKEHEEHEDMRLRLRFAVIRDRNIPMKWALISAKWQNADILTIILPRRAGLRQIWICRLRFGSSCLSRTALKLSAELI